MKRALAFTTALVVAATLLPARRAAAQASNFIAAPGADPSATAGWSLTPSLTYSGSFDDNVLMRGSGDVSPTDFLNVVNPGGTLNYTGRRSQVSANYSGAFVLYRNLDSLNSYDQHGAVFARRLLTPHVAVFVRNTLAAVPTTELAALVGVPFVRTGSHLEDLRGGVEAALTKRTSLVASYNFQLVSFDRTIAGAENLLGGHAQGGSATVKHVITSRTTLTGTYDLQHATVGTAGEMFDVQNFWAGAEYKLSDVMSISGAGGFSHLGVTQFSESRIGPAFRAGLVRQFRTTSVDVSYSRSFVPSYGFGGTTQNEEITARARVPFARRGYASPAFAWRSNDPLTDIGLPLRSFWIEGVVGYAVAPWVSVEGFFAGTHQTVDRPGGELNRNRVGFQVTTAKPVRVR